MTKKKRPELRVVLDTNAIFTQAAHYLLKREVFDLIQEHSQHQDLTITWYLPDVVLMEREYQMVRKALELLPNVGKLERLLGHNLNITEDILRRRVKDAIDSQVSSLGLTIAETDVSNINWGDLIKSAAFRLPPFSPTEAEKGFRDALILEAFDQLVSQSPATPAVCRIVLVTADDLLGGAIQARTNARKNVRVLPNLEDLKGLINTLASEVNEEFVEGIKQKASTYFFEPDKQDTIFYKEKIADTIAKKFATRLKALPSGADSVEQQQALVSSPRFDRKEGRRVFWITRIVYRMQAYRHVDKFPVGTSGGVFSGGLLNPFPSSAGAIRIGEMKTGGPFEPENTGLASAVVAKNFGIEPLSPSYTSLFSTYSTEKVKSPLKTGKIIFEVAWSVSVTTERHSFSAPRIDDVRYVESIWDAS